MSIDEMDPAGKPVVANTVVAGVPLALVTFIIFPFDVPINKVVEVVVVDETLKVVTDDDNPVMVISPIVGVTVFTAAILFKMPLVPSLLLKE